MDYTADIDKPFVIYKSSAGSGKTYTLTMEYLKLALAHPHAFKQILAVTFTNKATKEMKAQILRVLERLMLTVNPEEKLDNTLLSHLSLTEEQLKQKAAEVLSTILHHYADFSVSTIDSFFQRVVRAFAREIGLPAKFEIELDQPAVMERLVDRVITGVSLDRDLHRWLVDFADEKIREGKSWDIRFNIAQLGAEIFEEDFKKHQHEISAFLGDPNKIQKFRCGLFEERKAIKQKVLQIRNEAAAIIGRLGLNWTDFKGGSRSPLLFFERIGQDTELFPAVSASLASCPDNLEVWSTRKGPADLIEQAFHAGLNDLLKEALALLPRWNTLEVVRRNFYVYGIFPHLLAALRDLKDEENIMLISDANEFLKEITSGTEAPFIYEKVGNRYRNFLIDEFQDTSGFQWESFYPLIDNALASGNSSFIVGDVKQSIYRWRGGDLTLLLAEVEQQIGPERVQVKDLDTNFRSLPNIVNFNNALFQPLTLTLMAAAKDKYGVPEELLKTIDIAYRQVRQKVAPHKAHDPFKGMVRLEFLKKEEEKKVTELSLERLPGMVRTLMDQGYQLQDIAILVRKRAEGQQVAEALMGYALAHPDDGYAYEVLSDEALFLSKAASVKCLVAALDYLVHPVDDLADSSIWYHLLRLRGFEGEHELFDKNDFTGQLARDVEKFEQKKPELDQLPLYVLVEELIEGFGLNKLGKERAYISGFKEAVLDYVSKNKSDLSGFLEWWEIKKETRTIKIPEGHNAIRILTVHKAKGLQFKVVLMPFLDWDIMDSRGVIWSPYEGEGFPGLVVPLSLTAALAETSFAERYRQEVAMAYLDSLNLIYVALTRAEEVFWALGEAHNARGEGCLNKVSFNIQQAVQSGIGTDGTMDLRGFYDPEINILNIGAWPLSSMPTKRTAIEVPELSWRYRNWTQYLTVRKYSGDLSEEKAALQQKRKYGILIHRILERLKRTEDMEGLLKEAYFEGKLNLDEVKEMKQQLDRLFTLPQMQGWFSGSGQAFTEQGILLPGGARKRPDRIILEKDKAVVVDFKTGEADQSHRVQVREYVRLVETLTGKPTEGFLVYLESPEIVKIDPRSGAHGMQTKL